MNQCLPVFHRLFNTVIVSVIHVSSLLPAGLFLIIPCIDSYQKVDLRVVSFDVPPQEVRESSISSKLFSLEVQQGSSLKDALTDCLVNPLSGNTLPLMSKIVQR